jgi:hypothetical protein
MLRLVVFLVFALGLPVAAAACPGLSNKAKNLHFTARQLVAPKVAEVRAGGTVLLGQCDQIPGTGNIPFDPSVSILYVADRKRMDLELRTEGDCDTVLLVRSPAGRWFFDDDNGPGRNARIRIGTPTQGRYEVWVGSNGGVACQTRLALQSFRSVTKYAATVPVRRGLSLRSRM